MKIEKRVRVELEEDGHRRGEKECGGCNRGQIVIKRALRVGNGSRKKKFKSENSRIEFRWEKTIKLTKREKVDHNSQTADRKKP